MPALLPPQLHVFVRDWLSANNILLKSPDGHVLIDTGYSRHVPLTLALLATPRGLGDEPLAKIVVTHAHSDHIGGNAALVAKYGCRIAVPASEYPLIERWDTRALLLDYADQRADRFSADERLEAGNSHVWGNLEWQALAVPGHDNAALAFYNPEHRILISGDALWANGFGFVMPLEIDPAALPATRATIEMLARLDVRIVIPGHGEPFTEVNRALDRAMKRVESFEQDPTRMPRHVMKVFFTYALLDRRRVRCEDLPGYVERIGIYRDFNRMFFHLPPAQFAQWLVGSLEDSRAVRREGGWVMPA